MKSLQALESAFCNFEKNNRFKTVSAVLKFLLDKVYKPLLKSGKEKSIGNNSHTDTT
jgi:hypothetical protein